MSPQKLGMSQYDILDMIDEGTPIKKEVIIIAQKILLDCDLHK